MPDTALATNGHVLDKSKTNPFEKTGHGFVNNISTCPDVVDKSVSALASNGQIRSMEFDYSMS